jgi:hypothetical protein
MKRRRGFELKPEERMIGGETVETQIGSCLIILPTIILPGLLLFAPKSEMKREG